MKRSAQRGLGVAVIAVALGAAGAGPASAATAGGSGRPAFADCPVVVSSYGGETVVVRFEGIPACAGMPLVPTRDRPGCRVVPAVAGFT